MLITIDGPAGVGKSTVAKRLAEKLQCDYFDTGAMYRSATWFLLEKGCSFNDEIAVKNLLKEFKFDISSEDGAKRYFVNGIDVSEKIRSLEVTEAVSVVSAKGFIRHELVKIQRKYAQRKSAVFEGRDMGTVVFPKADLKFYLTAKPAVRAKRRFQELKAKGTTVACQKILDDIKKRDHLDMTREISPLKKADDAIAIDTSNMTKEEVIDRLYSYYQKRTVRTRPYFFKMRPFYAFVLFLCWCFCKVFFRLKVYGSQNLIKGRAILAANHLSYFDPPVAASSSLEEMHFLAKAPLFKIPIFSFIIRQLNSHPISGTGSDASTFKQVASLLKEEKKILLFPEGERSVTGQLAPLLPGVGFLAYLSKAPILPLFIQGTYELWPRTKKWPKLFGKVRVVFGKPIYPEEFAHLDKKEAIKQMSERLEAAFKDLQGFLQSQQKNS